MTDEVFREIASFLPPPVVRYYHEALDRELEPKRVRTKGGTLFLDMSGFTALTEKLAAEGTVGAEKISTVLNQHYEELLKIIDSFGGEVVKFAGDALVAIWPCPEVIPSLDRAAELVLVCATNIAKLQAVLEKKLGEVLKFKQGLAVGDLDLVYVGGVDEKWEFLIKGEALEHAVFAEGCASPGDIILSPKLFKLIATRVVAKSLSSGCYLLRDKKFNVRKHVTHPIELNGEVLTKLRSFLPPTVTNKIDARQLQYMGELRSVSVLFLNLPDIHSRAPLDRDQTVFQLVQDVVYSFDGEVNKLSVDDKGVSVIAVWGIPPRIAEGGGERAVRAAMGIQNKLSEQSIY